MKFRGLAPGDVLFDDYKIIEKIKIGGMGAVYKSTSLKTGEFYALKELISFSLDEAENKEAISRFEREARILSNLSHPSLPGVIDYFSKNDRYYLIMDFVEGKDLSNILKERGAPGLPEEEVIEWMIQICDVLIYLHTRDPVVIYRDIKPSNIMVREKDNKITLIDFGIARTLQKGTDVSRTKTTIGTIGYMSPEQYRGRPDPRSDIYSLGVTMYHLLTGSRPIPFNVIALLEEDTYLSEKIKSIAINCVKINSKERFQSAMDLKKALMGFADIVIPAKPRRGLRAVRKVRKIEDPFDGVDPGKILSMAKGTKDKRITPYLIDILLSDPEEKHRRSAANALGNLGDKKAAESLIIALGDFDEYVCTNAAWALGELGSPHTVEILLPVYFEKRSKTFKNSLKKAIIKIAYKRQAGEVMDLLFQLIEKKISPERDGFIEKIPLFFPSLELLLLEFMRESEGYEVRFQVGILYYYCEKFDDAMIHFEKAYKLKEKNPEVLFFIGKTYQKKKEIEKAIEVYKKALKLRFGKTRVMDNSAAQLEEALISIYDGLALEMAGKGFFLEELKYYDELIKALPNYKETTFFRGLAAMKKNNTREAIKYFNLYVEENPQGHRAIKASEYLENLQSGFFSRIDSMIKGIFGRK